METLTKTLKIPAVKIHVPFCEGPSEWSNQTFADTLYASCWDQFQEYAKTIANTYSLSCLLSKQKWLGYLKIDFVIIFVDGEEYSGRYDLQENGLADGESLAQHVKNFCSFCCGRFKPKHLIDQEYKTVLENYKDDAANFAKFLDNYDIPA